MSNKIEKLINDINKHYGYTIISKGKNVKSILIRRLETGIFSFDYEIGGGLPLGRIIMVHGQKSSGKTTLAFKIISKVQKKKDKNVAIYVDLEGSFDREWAEINGVDVENLLIVQPDIAEKGLNIAYELVKSGECGIVVIDSFGAIIPEEELGIEIGEQPPMAIRARKCNLFIRQITSALQPKDLTNELELNECIVLILNQERATMDKYQPIALPGGMGKDFHSSIIIQLKRGDWIAEKDGNIIKKIVGHEIWFKITKNKTFASNRTGVFDFYFDDSKEYKMKKGDIDYIKDIVNYGITYNFIERNGAIYVFKDKKFKGKEQLFEFFKHQSKSLLDLKNLILRTIAPVKPSIIKDKEVNI